MKYIIEMSRQETEQAINNGTLLRLLQGQEPIGTGIPVSGSTDLAEVPATVEKGSGKDTSASVQEESLAPIHITEPVMRDVAAPETPQVATVAATYSLDDLASAAMGLMENGLQLQLQELLKEYGVEALPQLPKEQYGAFATALRGMGAKI